MKSEKYKWKVREVGSLRVVIIENMCSAAILTHLWWNRNDTHLRIQEHLHVREGKLSNASIVRFINGFRDILSSWMSDVVLCGMLARAGKLLIENRLHVMRLARGDHGEWTCSGNILLLIQTKLSSVRAFGVKPHGRAYANGLRDKSAENRDKQENWYSSN